MAYTAANDAFCAQADVEGLVGSGAFTSSTKPTAQQCLDWMARIAAEVESKLAEAGSSYTVAQHGSSFPATPTDPKVGRLKVLAESANAIGAAAQLLYMHDVKDEYGRVPSSIALFEQYAGILESIGTEVETSQSVAVFSDDKVDGLQFLTSTEF
jgi:hypothetical protein